MNGGEERPNVLAGSHVKEPAEGQAEGATASSPKGMKRITDYNEYIERLEDLANQGNVFALHVLHDARRETINLVSTKTRKPRIRPNTFITIVERPDPINYPERIHAYVFHVKNVGVKYVHGRIVRREDGEVKEALWDAKINLEEAFKVYDAERWDIVEEINQYNARLRKWEEEREKARREIRARREYEALRLAEKDFKEWEENNPRPDLPRIVYGENE